MSDICKYCELAATNTVTDSLGNTVPACKRHYEEWQEEDGIFDSLQRVGLRVNIP